MAAGAGHVSGRCQDCGGDPAPSRRGLSSPCWQRRSGGHGGAATQPQQTAAAHTADVCFPHLRPVPSLPVPSLIPGGCGWQHNSAGEELTASAFWTHHDALPVQHCQDTYQNWFWLPTLQAAATPEGGLASWLRMSSHLSKPPGQPQRQLASPAGSDKGEGGVGTRVQLDFAVVQPKAGAGEPATQASPMPASPHPGQASRVGGSAATAAGQAGAPQPWPTPPTSPALNRRKPAAAPAAAAPVSPSTSSRGFVQRALLALCMQACLLAAPVALHAMAPHLAQRYGLGDAAAQLRGECSCSCAATCLADLDAKQTWPGLLVCCYNQ